MQFYFYIKLLSMHKSAFINALASRNNSEVTVFSEYTMMDRRSEMGWVVPDLINVKIIVKPEVDVIERTIDDSDENSVHVFHGVLAPPYIPKALNMALRKRKKIAIWAEPYNWIGFSGNLRYLRSVYHRFKYGKGINFLIPTGNKGVETNLKAGYPKEKVFEWGYFTERLSTKVASPPDSIFKICFVGALIKRKGVDVLLKAVAKLNTRDVQINIVGEGILKKELENIVTKNSLKNVVFHNYMQNEDVCKFIGSQDLLILPSRWDGWGAVVNEALMQGTPVICSDTCGASVLLNNENSSSIFKSGSINSLAYLIQERIDKGKVEPEERNKIRIWAECISGEEAATYFLNIINHILYNGPRPSPPWKTLNSNSSLTLNKSCLKNS